MAFYFAYGSNMASARIAARAPSARALGAARLAGFAWCCDKRGADGTAKANLARVPGAETLGVLYAIDDADFETLDRAEAGYARIVAEVECGGRRLRAHCYVSEQRSEGAAPAADYVAWMVAGAREHGLPDAWIATIEAAARTRAASIGDARRSDARGTRGSGSRPA